MACDICEARGTTLTELRQIYQTPEIKAICPSCEAIVNKKLTSIQGMTAKMTIGLLCEFMQRRRPRQQGAASE